MRVSIEVRRNDGTRVAYVEHKEVSFHDDILLASLKTDAKRLSWFYGRGFYVEVWVVLDPYPAGANPQLNDYHRAYVFAQGRTVSMIGW